MTAYPVTCLVDYEDGERATLTVEDASDADVEAGAIKRLVIVGPFAAKELRIGLSPEAVDALVRALRRTRR